jgi:hypothetical protein
VEDGLRRAFEMQMRLVGEARRELEAAEARRLRRRDREREGESGAGAGALEGGLDGQRRRRRRRRRSHERWSPDDERRRRERREARPRRNEDDLPEPASEVAGRTRRGFRAFLHDAIDVTDYVLFGGSSKRRD